MVLSELNIIKEVDATIGTKYLETMVDFQSKLAFESEGIELDKSVLVKGISRVINDKNLGVYYLAFDAKNNLLGMLLTISEWSDWRCKNVLWIHSVYIEKSARRLGLFSQMYNHIKEIVLASADYAGIRLYVDNTNKVAISVYNELGMNDEHYRLFEWLKE